MVASKLLYVCVTAYRRAVVSTAYAPFWEVVWHCFCAYPWLPEGLHQALDVRAVNVDVVGQYAGALDLQCVLLWLGMQWSPQCQAVRPSHNLLPLHNTTVAGLALYYSVNGVVIGVENVMVTDAARRYCCADANK